MKLVIIDDLYAGDMERKRLLRKAQSQNWNELRLAAIDVETTGFDPTEDRIIEVGIVSFAQGEVVDSWGTLVNPLKPIPQEWQSLTGISEKDVQDAPTFDEIAHIVDQMLKNGVVCAYNLRFDQGFVRAEMERCGCAWPDEAPMLDPLIFARQLQKEHSSKRLGDMAVRLGIPLENSHRATDDACVAGKVMFAFAPQLPERLTDLLVFQLRLEHQEERKMAFWRKMNVLSINGIARPMEAP